MLPTERGAGCDDGSDPVLVTRAPDERFRLLGRWHSQRGDLVGARSWHRAFTRRNFLPGSGIDQRAVFQQHKTIIRCHVKNFGCPEYTARIVSAQNSEEITGFFSYVGKAAKHARR